MLVMNSAFSYEICSCHFFLSSGVLFFSLLFLDIGEYCYVICICSLIIKHFYNVIVPYKTVISLLKHGSVLVSRN